MIAIYIRTSTEDQNPENQLKDCEQLTNNEQYSLYKDQQSAWKEDKERLDFERLKKDIQSKKIHMLIVWDIDRLYRNRLRLKEFLQFCKIYKCNVLSYRQAFLNNIVSMPEPFNEMMYDFMINWFGWLAEDESKKKSERVKIAVRKIVGERTKSYKGNLWGRKTLPDSVKQEIIKKHSEGLSLRSIAKSVYYTDKNNHKKNVSLGTVHKLLHEIQTL